MKKIAAIFTFLLAFSLSASAQESQLSPDELAKKDTMELNQYLGLSDEQQKNFVALFKQKHKVLSNPSLTEARKAEVMSNTAAKINASITADQQQKLAANPELLDKLSR